MLMLDKDFFIFVSNKQYQCHLPYLRSFRLRVTNKCSTQFWQFIHAFRFITGSGFLYNLFHALNGISDVDC